MSLTKNKHILIVEDDRFMTFLERTILNKVLKEVPLHEAENGFEGLEYIVNMNNEENDLLIFLDINMPKMNGFEFLDEIHNLPPSCNYSVVMVTSSLSKEDKIKSFSYPPVKNFITKPLTPERLIEVIPNDWQELVSSYA